MDQIFAETDRMKVLCSDLWKGKRVADMAQDTVVSPADIDDPM